MTPRKSEEQQEGGSGEVEAGAREYDPQSMFLPSRMCLISPEAKHSRAWLALGRESITSKGSQTRAFMLFPLDIQFEKQELWEDPVSFGNPAPFLPGRIKAIR